MPFNPGDLVRQVRNPGPRFQVVATRTAEPIPSLGRFVPVEVVDAVNVVTGETVELLAEAVEPAFTEG